MKTSLWLLSLALLLSSCTTRGPHVARELRSQPDVVKYYCEFSESFFTGFTRVAMCDTQEECNLICSTFWRTKGN